MFTSVELAWSFTCLLLGFMPVSQSSSALPMKSEITAQGKTMELFAGCPLLSSAELLTKQNEAAKSFCKHRCVYPLGYDHPLVCISVLH